MVNESHRGTSTSAPAKLTRLAGFVVIALAGIALALNLIALLNSGQLEWRGLMTSVGLVLLGCAFVVGPQYRKSYNALLGASIALVGISLASRIAG